MGNGIEGNGRDKSLKLPISLVEGILLLFLAAALTGQINLWARVRTQETSTAKIEQHLADIDRRLERMESKIDDLTERR